MIRLVSVGTSVGRERSTTALDVETGQLEAKCLFSPLAATNGNQCVRRTEEYLNICRKLLKKIYLLYYSVFEGQNRRIASKLACATTMSHRAATL